MIAAKLTGDAIQGFTAYEREFHYSAGAERALSLAREHGWTAVSVKDD